MPKIPTSLINLPETDQEVINTRYYRFTECCSGIEIYFAINSSNNTLIPNGVHIYDEVNVVGVQAGYEPNTGTYIPLVKGNCYKTELLLTGEGEPIGTGAEYALLTEAPLAPDNYTLVGDETTDCTTPSVVAACPECTTCYIVITCDGLSYTTSNDLSAYVGTSATVVFPDNPELSPTCAQIGLAPDGYTCAEKATNILVDPETPCECDCTCYTIVGAAESLLYVDCTGEIIQENLISGTFGPFCSRTYPILVYSDLDNPPIISSNGLCTDADFDGVFDCPSECYTLTDCDGIEDPIITNSNLSFYLISGYIVKISGSDSCWIVSSAQSCDCAVSVSVLQYYTSCETCKSPINYKLTECDTGEIVYTSSDLSAHVGNTIIRNECPGCWLVDQLDTNIPTDVIVTVASSFDDCETCNLTYYSLTNCEDPENVIYTSEDLSQYTNQIITLKWCPNICWTVAVTQAPGETTLVIPSITYQSCEECIRAKTSICVRVQNVTAEQYSFQYYDLDNTRQTLIIAANSFSEKFCLSGYSTSDSIVIREYGDCVDGECPVVETPKEIVKPGYNSKTCDNEYFDRITCEYSERMYKQVMSLRYGISNCCDDLTETYKLEIKKAILNLDIINDPDYTCTTYSDCGCPQTYTYTYTRDCNS